MHDITKELERITKKYSSLITNDELTHYYTNADLKTKQIILKEIEYSFIPGIKLKNKNLKNMTKEGFNNSLLIIQHEGNKTKIKYLLNWVKENKELSKEVKELEPTNNNPHPSIFEDEAFNVFEKWINTSKDTQEKRISFIFQKLKKEGKLRNTTFKILSEWAFKNNYIDETNYNKLLVSDCFLSPSKILTKKRLDIYNLIKV